MNKFNKIIADVLRVKPDEINDNTSPINVETWDSFAGILLISEIEKIFNIEFSMSEIISIKDIGSIKNILEKHDINLNEQ